MIWLFHCFTSSVGRIIFSLRLSDVFSLFSYYWTLPCSFCEFYQDFIFYYQESRHCVCVCLNDISLIHLSYVYHVNHTITLKKRKFYLFFIYLPDAFIVLGSTWTSKCMSMVISFVVVFVVYFVSEYKNQNIHHVKWI